MTDLVRVNSTILSATSCSWRVDLNPYVGILALDYADKRERKIVYASRRDGQPLGKTSGKYSVGNFGFTMLRDSFDKLTTQLTVKGLGSYGDAEFTFTAQYIEPTQPPITVVIDGCNIEEVKESFAEGIDELVTEVTCTALTLTRNGKRLWSVVRGIPL